MSRIGREPIKLPKGVEIKIDNSQVFVKGPKGDLNLLVRHDILVSHDSGIVQLQLGKNKNAKTNFLGLYRALIMNMVKGVSEGFEKKLELIGVGYRAAVQGSDLNLLFGFSHPTKLSIPNSLQVKVDNNTLITVSGPDKREVGQFAATIRAFRKPEPYKGKGARYQGEYVRKKAGKSGAKK